jgi:hypothetical protein
MNSKKNIKQNGEESFFIYIVVKKYMNTASKQRTFINDRLCQIIGTTIAHVRSQIGITKIWSSTTNAHIIGDRTFAIGFAPVRVVRWEKVFPF